MRAKPARVSMASRAGAPAAGNKCSFYLRSCKVRLRSPEGAQLARWPLLALNGFRRDLFGQAARLSGLPVFD